MTWHRLPLKHLAEVSVSNVDKKTAEGEVPVRLVNYTDVYFGDRLTPALDLMEASASPSQVRAFRLRGGDVVITKDSETAEDIGIAAYVESTADSLLLGYHLALLRPHRHLTNGRYLYWLMSGSDARGQLESGATGVTRFGLRSDVIASVGLSAPGLTEQQAIADFLDAETAHIDALVRSKRLLVDRIGDRCQATIDNLVLGLEAQVFQPSRLGFFSQVPRRWSETEVRHLECAVQTGPFGSQLHAADYVEGGWPVVNPANLKNGGIVSLPSMTISTNKRAELSRHILRSGDIVFGRRGEMGRAGLVATEHEGWLCGTGSLRVRLSQRSPLTSPYLKLLLESSALRNYFELTSVGSTMDNLNSEILLGMPCLVPPIPDQEKIVSQVQRVRANTDALVQRLNQQIELLQVRRQALITVAVAGQLDIPGVAA